MYRMTTKAAKKIQKEVKSIRAEQWLEVQG